MADIVIKNIFNLAQVKWSIPFALTSLAETDGY